MRDDRNSAVQRYPLEWPTGWVRTPAHKRRASTFGSVQTANRRVTVAVAVRRLSDQLERLGAQSLTLSTNVELRLDGTPRSDGREPTDLGAAVYFRFRGRATVLACDRYRTVAENIAALAAHVDALRRIERYGVGTLEQALAGYRALPADTAADWRTVFGFGSDSRPTRAQVQEAYKRQAKCRHPDVGGSEAGMTHLNRARDYALAETEGEVRHGEP